MTRQAIGAAGLRAVICRLVDLVGGARCVICGLWGSRRVVLQLSRGIGQLGGGNSSSWAAPSGSGGAGPAEIVVNVQVAPLVRRHLQSDNKRSLVMRTRGDRKAPIWGKCAAPAIIAGPEWTGSSAPGDWICEPGQCESWLEERQTGVEGRRAGMAAAAT